METILLIVSSYLHEMSLHRGGQCLISYTFLVCEVLIALASPNEDLNEVEVSKLNHSISSSEST